MAGRTTYPLVRVVAVLTLLGHVAAVVRDAQACERNLLRFLDRPTGANLLRLLLAEGVLIRDLGMGA